MPDPVPGSPSNAPAAAKGAASAAKKLPTWAWIAIVAGGLAVGLVLRSRQKASETDALSPDGTDATGEITPPDNALGATYQEGQVYSPDSAGVVASAGPLGGPSVILLPSAQGPATTATGTSATGEDAGQGVTGGGAPARENPEAAHGGQKYVHDHKHPPKKKPPKGTKWWYAGEGQWVLIPIKKVHKAGKGGRPARVK